MILFFSKVGEKTIPFEYKSKAEFIYDFQKKHSPESFQHKRILKMSETAQLFWDVYLTKEHVQFIESYIFTFEEFISKFKEIPKL